MYIKRKITVLITLFFAYSAMASGDTGAEAHKVSIAQANEISSSLENQAVTKGLQEARGNVLKLAIVGLTSTARLASRIIAKWKCEVRWKSSSRRRCRNKRNRQIDLTKKAMKDTKNLYEQARKLEDTIKDLCGKKDASCITSSPPTPDSCNKYPEYRCKALCERIPSCCIGKDCSTASLTGGGSDTDEGVLAGVYGKGKEEKDLFKVDENFSLKNMSPEEKKEYQAQLKDLENQTKKYMKEVGLTDKDFKEMNNINNKGLYSGNSLAGSNIDTGNNTNRGLDEYSPNGNQKTKKSKLAQLGDQFKNFYNGQSISEKDIFAEKSIQFGSDFVGVIEDNIFMMVHRRHRSLEDDKDLFIQ